MSPPSTTAEIAGGTGSAAIMLASEPSSRGVDAAGAALAAAASARAPPPSARIDLLASSSIIGLAKSLVAAGAGYSRFARQSEAVARKLEGISVGRFNETVNHAREPAPPGLRGKRPARRRSWRRR